MELWLHSVYSDGTEQFVSNPQPGLGETVTVRLRLYADAPVRHILLRDEPNGCEHTVEMTLECVKNGLAYYRAPLLVNQTRVTYRFYLVCDDVIYQYNQKGITTGIPDKVYDFQLLTGYRQPEWVKEAVFYQIFPERFCNGNPENDVKNGEFQMDGHPSIHMDWDSDPLPYEKGFCLDHFGGDLDGITQKIPYLKKLGVNAIYLNPIFVAPSVHKYDCIDYFQVDPHFGGNEALARLCQALHANDMKIVLDISINHTGIFHKWFNRDGICFDKSVGAFNNPDSPERGYYFFDGENNHYLSWQDVDTLPTLNYSNSNLRDIIYRAEDSVLKKWLKPPYQIDGWRFDVADVCAKNDAHQYADEIWPEIRTSIREENPQAYILAEDWGDCSDRLQGEEWDAPMNYFGCTRILREFFGGRDLFFERNPILHEVPYQTSAEQVEQRVTGFLAKLPYVVAQNQFNLLDSHDVPRLHTMPHMTPDSCRAAVILMFTLLGAPSVYYGDEAGIGGWHESIEGCRFPMPWKKDIEGTETYQFYHTLCELKRSVPALSHGGMKFLYAKGKILSIARFDGSTSYISVASAGTEDEIIELPLSLIGAKAPSEAADCFGTPLRYVPSEDGRSILLTVEAGKGYLFSAT